MNTVTTISLEAKYREWRDKKKKENLNFNFSRWIREKIEEEMSKEEIKEQNG